MMVKILLGGWKMILKVLRTGNSGNSYLITTENPQFEDMPKSIMVDCGGERIKDLKPLEDVGCICITHSHYDHVSALGWFLHDLKYKPIVVLSEDEYNIPSMQNNIGLRYGIHVNVVRIGKFDDYGMSESFCVGNFVIKACKAKHDTDCPLHYFISDGKYSVFVGCDTAEISESALSLLSQSDAVILESNYSWKALKTNRLDGKKVSLILNEEVKTRLEAVGHLSNTQFKALLPYLKQAKKIMMVHMNILINSEKTIKNEVGRDNRFIICNPDYCPYEVKING